MTRLGAAILIVLIGLSHPEGVRPQGASPVRGWNSEASVRLIERAIQGRLAPRDSLRDYRARAQAHVYFLFDTGRDTERQLVKADQLALQLYWRAPGESRQVFVGRREKKTLPTDISYHLDHLMVVMDDFPDSLSLGEGMEVNSVLHPLAAGAPGYYEYRLTDSLTLVLPDRELWVYRVDVRPRDPASPGVVGALYVERDAAAVVRMEFTFTAASYLDPQLDYINVRIENALWEGKYWLPFRQGLELRRQFDLLSFPAGGVIRSEVRVADYRFNAGVPSGLFTGPEVISLPRSRLRSYEFESGLYEALDPETAREELTLDEVRREASELVARSQLERSEYLKLAVPGISSVLRFRRADGLYLGPGLRRSVPGLIELTLLGGYAIGADRWSARGAARHPLKGGFYIEVAGYVNEAADATAWPASSGLLATLATLVDGEDYREPYWKDGARLTLGRRWEDLEGRISLIWEDWDPARLGAADLVDRAYRPVRPVAAGDALMLSAEVERRHPGLLGTVGGTSWQLSLEGASRTVAGSFEYVRGAFRAATTWPDAVLGLGIQLSAEAGAVAGGNPPPAKLFFAGGRGTVRGYDYHRFAGDVFGFAHAELSRPLRYPYLSAAAFVDVGWIGFEGTRARQATALWEAAGTPVETARGPLLGVGAGLGLFFDILRLEAAHGLTQDGEWEIVVRVSPRFWNWL